MLYWVRTGLYPSAVVGQLVDESELKESFNFGGAAGVGFGFFELGIADA